MTPGFCHRIDSYRPKDSDDGFGGITQVLVLIEEDIAGRISILDGEAELKAFGEVSGKRWAVSLDKNPDVKVSDHLTLNPDSRAAPFPEGRYMKVVYHKPQIDDVGVFHHTLLYCEEVDEESAIVQSVQNT